jgi:poly-gamma-glutamate synthesis protein (capsule biosynthesis protein)
MRKGRCAVPEAGTVRLAAFGDIMLDRDVGAHYFEKPDDFEMADIRAAVEDCDIVFANLENPVSSVGTPDKIQKPRVTFCADPRSLAVLENIRINVVSLGNNHMLDYGGEALKATLANVEARGIHHAGAGANYAEANRDALMEKNGLKIAFLCRTLIYSASTFPAGKTTPGLADPDIKGILARIGALKSEGYLVVVSLHWGFEYQFYPIPFQRDYALQMVEAGASLILGHGPHYPQGYERYRKGLIFYSLGNFMFDEPYHFAKRTFFPVVTLTTEGVEEDFDIFPVALPNHVPKILQGAAGDKMIRLAHALAPIYARKNAAFWKGFNDKYFSDIVWRCRTMKSLRFLFLPPLSYYREVGLGNILKRLNLTNAKKLFSRA